LLRTPSQPVAPVAVIDLSRSPFCTTSIQPSDDNVILNVPLCTGAGASTNPANVLSDLAARSGATGNFISLNGSSVTIVANGSAHGARRPEASFGKSVPVNVARSLSSGHLNLSQPAGSCASAGTALTHRANTMHRSFTARLFSSHMTLSGNRLSLFGIMR